MDSAWSCVCSSSRRASNSVSFCRFVRRRRGELLGRRSLPVRLDALTRAKYDCTEWSCDLPSLVFGAPRCARSTTWPRTSVSACVETSSLSRSTDARYCRADIRWERSRGLKVLVDDSCKLPEIVVHQIYSNQTNSRTARLFVLPRSVLTSTSASRIHTDILEDF